MALTPVNLNLAAASAANSGGTASTQQRQQKFQIAFGQGAKTSPSGEGPSFTQLVAAAAAQQGGDSFSPRKTEKKPTFGTLASAKSHASSNPFQQALEQETNPFAQV